MKESFGKLCTPGQDCAILFARSPALGRVKTRLESHLTPEQACRLHCAMTSDVAGMLAQALPNAQKWIFFSDALLRTPASNGLKLPVEFSVGLQEGADLGERLGDAFTRALSSGARRVVIFGSDSPTLPPAVAAQAFEALADRDLVLGPTEDGGYYLIGCRRFHPALFENVVWSSPRAFEQTRANAERLGYTAQVLEPWFDVDEWQDLERLREQRRAGHSLPPHLAAFLE